MKSFRYFFYFLLVLYTAMSLSSNEQSSLLRFIHREGEVLHADALIDETVILNGALSHRASIEEFSVSSVISVDESGAAVLDSRFRTVENTHGYGGSLQWISEEKVTLKRENSGLMDVPKDAVLPVMRSIPRFPDYPVASGDSWTFPADELHVFRMRDGLHGPYRGTFQVHYRYLEKVKLQNRNIARIALEYNIYLPIRSPAEPVYMITGSSSQEILWDIELGCPVKKTENFEFMMMTTDGNTREFLGSTETEYRYTTALDREKESHALKETLPEIIVEPVDQGILLSLNEEEGRILFQPESALITDDQKALLAKIALSLDAYQDRDILITGHTADYGTAAGRESLSFERASAVAEELFPRGRRGTGRLFLRGAGSREPVGTDRQNRRVEILILD